MAENHEKIRTIRDAQELTRYLDEGNTANYVFFWGHQPWEEGVPGKSCLSQWYESPFELDGVRYLTAEHYMMAEKARLFGDREAEAKVLASTDPGDAKKLGREIRGFDNETWYGKRVEIVVKGNHARFSQHERLREFIISTGARVLVEASPVDAIWGIGLAAAHRDAANPHRWKGLNLLGFALMEVRERLKA
jgi:ribA/ribD-fused uncharacterized protein